MKMLDYSPSGRRRANPGVYRKLTEWRYDLALEKFGADHPETQAALGRFIATYGESFEDVFEVDIPENSEPLNRALYRQSGADGYMNKGWRKRMKGKTYEDLTSSDTP